MQLFENNLNIYGMANASLDLSLQKNTYEIGNYFQYMTFTNHDNFYKSRI